MKIYVNCVLVMLAAAGLINCSSPKGKPSSKGSSTASSSDPGLGATAPIDLSAYCTATVTKDVVVKFFSGSDWFTVKTGEKLAQMTNAMSGTAKLLRFTKSGYAYDVSDLTSGDFTSNCSEGSEGAEELVALADVNIYSDPDLTTKICSFTKGQAVVSSSYGHILVKETLDSSTYELIGDAFSSNCSGGSGKYYASFPSITVNETGTTTTLFAPLRKKT